MTGILDGNLKAAWLLTLTIDVASVAANTTAEQDFTVNGLKTADLVFVNKPSLNAGLGVCNARVKSANTLSLTFNNNTAAAIDPGSEAYTLLIVRPESSLATALPA